ncbi:MAG: argininosuccinate lyase [Desulfobacterales bacterium]|nr:argininosuccinate lyase [Desulfobacterales bacterium]
MTTDRHQIWGKRLSDAPDGLALAFTSGRDVAGLPMADELLLPYDVWTNLAHVRMLHRCSVLTEAERRELCRGLTALEADWRGGGFRLDPAKEDVHVNIEHHLTHTLGLASGKKIHTGRSRNDQAGCDIKLYLRDQLLQLADRTAGLIARILAKAPAELDAVMPGFTHYQPAMITTAAHWLTAWSQALLRDLERICQDLEMLNRSPLGAAAAFGTSWGIDREYAAELLGFDAPEENTLDCISARGEHEARAVAALSFLMNHLATMAQDMILLGMPYYGMLAIPDRFVTGSSIMPQKRNPDFAELIRGRAALCHGLLAALLGVQKGSMSGYNRDFQLSKYAAMDAFRECAEAPLLMGEVVAGMSFRHAEMRAKALQGFMNSADVADLLARRHGLSFRDCYDLLSLAVKHCDAQGELTLAGLERAAAESEIPLRLTEAEVVLFNTPEALLAEKRHAGAPSRPAVEAMIASQAERLNALGGRVGLLQARVLAARRASFADD